MIKNKGSFLVRFRHPKKDLSFLSEELGMTSVRSWKAGSPRETPDGDALKGFYADSYWFSRSEFSSYDELASLISKVVCILETKIQIVSEVKSSGGCAEIYLQFNGEENIGCVINCSDLIKMGEIGVDLLIEVFPGMNKSKY